jgi:hypothetical protein
MAKRHESIGIKEVIRCEWLDKAVNLLLSGLDSKAIRAELHEYLSCRKGDGTIAERSVNTRSFVVNNIMNIWVNPARELLPLRDDALCLIREKPDSIAIMNWAMLCAAYPFWYYTAIQTGRLLNLQEQVSQRQIITRLKEQYGDRNTIDRYAQYVIRSFLYWNVLYKTNKRGIYIYGNNIEISDTKEIALLCEAILRADKSGKSTMRDFVNSPALFPFTLKVPSVTNMIDVNSRLKDSAYSVEETYIFIEN